MTILIEGAIYKQTLINAPCPEGTLEPLQYCGDFGYGYEARFGYRLRLHAKN